MPEDHLETMGFDEFQLVADEFIDRSSQEFGEMPASTFFKLLLEKLNGNPSQLEAKNEVILRQNLK